MAIDQCKSRPAHIHAILTGLDRYNPETTAVFQDYVAQQCEDRTFDCYANLALLKLYQFNPHLLHAETTTNILAKALTVFPSPAFSLCLALLPPYTQPFATTPPIPPPTADTASYTSTAAAGAGTGAGAGAAGGASASTPAPAPASTPSLPVQTADFIEAVQKLAYLSHLLDSAQYGRFWAALAADDVYADLTADLVGFEELVRVRVAVEVGKAFRALRVDTLREWLGLRERAAVTRFVVDVCGWVVEEEDDEKAEGGGWVRVPINKENEARGEVKGEKVSVEMFGRVIRRGFEAAA